jgi:hypothetical protein
MMAHGLTPHPDFWPNIYQNLAGIGQLLEQTIKQHPKAKEHYAFIGVTSTLGMAYVAAAAKSVNSATCTLVAMKEDLDELTARFPLREEVPTE